jgi:predicted ATPase/uncharacterized protein YfkK (UPF0435 family)
MEQTSEVSDTLGAAESIVERFSIEGLYGYRTVGLSSKYAATILIAKNGSGKTTLLGALDAFLKGQFGRLSGIQFSLIRCKLRGDDDELCLSYDDVVSIVTISEDSVLYEYARLYGLDPAALLDFVEYEYPALKREQGAYFDHPIYDIIKSKVNYSSVEAKKICDRITSSLSGRNQNVDNLRAKIKSVIGDTEIVYLPTYRRVELPLADNHNANVRPARRKPKMRDFLGLPGRSLFNAEIQFGLSDISDRLSKLNQQIVNNSNLGYRQISANIINELLSGALERNAANWGEVPDRESLSLFFSRLEDGRRTGPFGDISIPDIDKIYSREDMSVQSNTFLTYFLSKLNAVIKTTRDTEVLVEEFVRNCNRYLSASDETTTVSGKHPEQKANLSSQDGKVLKLDRRNLRVSVESLAANRKISLDALSSGEKQMISLFARLYLYPGKKIVLIDEPELSLSIDWQTKILVDLISAPSCSQVIAITHSPFVFDNELEPFAKSLSVKIEAQQRAVDDEYEDEGQDNIDEQ